MKRGKTYDWIPLYRQKWLWGSTRLELDPAERGVFIDLLCIAGNDDGFIQANPDTAYPIAQLAGMLCVPVKIVESTIEKCIKFGKLERNEQTGILFVVNWNNYSLSPSYKKAVQSDKVQNCTMENTVPDSTSMYKSSSSSLSEEGDLGGGFSKFWEAYPIKQNKKDSQKAFNVLRRTESLETIAKAFNGYMDFLKSKRLKENFEQKPMYASSFLRSERWREFVDFKYTPEM